MQVRHASYSCSPEQHCKPGGTGVEEWALPCPHKLVQGPKALAPVSLHARGYGWLRQKTFEMFTNKSDKRCDIKLPGQQTKIRCLG